jgi:hypothetical protein
MNLSPPRGFRAVKLPKSPRLRKFGLALVFKITVRLVENEGEEILWEESPGGAGQEKEDNRLDRFPRSV